MDVVAKREQWQRALRQLLVVLHQFLSPINARAVHRSLVARVGDSMDPEAALQNLSSAISFLVAADRREPLLSAARLVFDRSAAPPPPPGPAAPSPSPPASASAAAPQPAARPPRTTRSRPDAARAEPPRPEPPRPPPPPPPPNRDRLSTDEMLAAPRPTTLRQGELPGPTVAIRSERDLNEARLVARQLCQQAGLSGFAAQKFVTAVSELTRNVAKYAPPGRALFSNDVERRRLRVVVMDQGPGIARVEEVLRGEYRSKTGMGLGLSGTRRLVDDFDVVTSSRGTTIAIAVKY